MDHHAHPEKHEDPVIQTTDESIGISSGTDDIGAQPKPPAPHSNLPSPTSTHVEPLSSTVEHSPAVPAQPAPAVVNTDGDTGVPFLTEHIMVYLRGVSPAEKWQTLLTQYIAFEKGGPPNGVPFSMLRGVNDSLMHPL